MRIGGRLQGAIEILADVEERRRPIANALKDWGTAHRFAGSGDRAAIGNIVYDALRLRLSHAWLMDDDSPAALAHAVLFRQWGIAPEALAERLDGDKFAPVPLSEAALKAFASRNLADAPDDVRGDLPEWILPAFKRNFGENWLAEAEALNLRPPLDLRVNTLKATREKVLKALSRSGAGEGGIAPEAIRIPPGSGPDRLPNVTAELSFQKGWFEVQDQGSQIVAKLVGAKAGDQALDFCAGGGGKTLALAAAMENAGQVHAYDADRTRLAPIIERLKRAGTRNVQVHDALDGLSGLEARFDHVLVDAPCTGTGTWRRRPDIKWRLSEKNLEERTAQQAEVLVDAARFVKPGGHLVYVTCSLLPAENQDQITRFLQGETGSSFATVDIDTVWSAVFPGVEARPHLSGSGFATLTPAATGTDGFFCAILVRKS
ncbi:RsmB/NOP family class I SAM-dependent RNA methyltransferase [Martelella lutilitoris]|uniref:RsmB/NOP family class I SAM-dependent RNA methyltransferase n=1 Tax=Martelella lutilitoris TaxID=2583532 RepID=A0A5C4JQF8_9HYPH|nr:RsmB/NOP family class I SAM-dependent RNA methyltransferase [Martelella lutilitoris]TNB47422.1 RsmB/NOP family class I SAM-dependent RNA methyltransferase [Martelella lutilitoris]